MPIRVGGAEIEHTLLVANISNDAILGLDFLRGHKCQVIWDEECFTVGHYRVPLQKRPEEPVICRVRLAENIVVPPSSEVFLECQVVSDDHAGKCYRTGGAFANDHSVLVANALVETRDNRVPVRLLNPSSEAITIRKGKERTQPSSNPLIVSYSWNTNTRRAKTK